MQSLVPVSLRGYSHLLLQLQRGQTEFEQKCKDYDEQLQQIRQELEVRKFIQLFHICKLFTGLFQKIYKLVFVIHSFIHVLFYVIK